MKQWLAKLGQGMTRLTRWRKPAAAPAGHAAAGPHRAQAASAPSHASLPEPTVGSIPAPVAAPAVAAPVPDIHDAALGDGLAELGDPVAMPIQTMPMQNEIISSEALYTPQPGDDELSAFDVLSAPDPLGSEPEPARAVEADSPQADSPAVTEPSATDFTAAESPAQSPLAPPDTLEAPAEGRVPRWTLRARALVAAIRPFRLARPGMTEGVRVLMGLMGKKRVWIPGLSLALLGALGSLTFLLVQSSSEKARLQADLNAAKLALKQADKQLGVVVIPPLLAVPAPPADGQPERAPVPVPAPAEAAAPTTPAPIHVARASGTRAPVQMACDLSDKASVNLNLKQCIEAFNDATGR